MAALLLLFTHREGCAEKNKVPAAVLLAVMPSCGCPAIDYYRDTQHGAMEPWSTSTHKKHRILHGFVVSEQPLLYRVYVRIVGVYSGIMYGCVRYVLRVSRVDSGWGVQILFVAS